MYREQVNLLVNKVKFCLEKPESFLSLKAHDFPLLMSYDYIFACISTDPDNEFISWSLTLLYSTRLRIHEVHGI